MSENKAHFIGNLAFIMVILIGNIFIIEYCFRLVQLWANALLIGINLGSALIMVFQIAMMLQHNQKEDIIQEIKRKTTKKDEIRSVFAAFVFTLANFGVFSAARDEWEGFYIGSFILIGLLCILLKITNLNRNQISITFQIGFSLLLNSSLLFLNVGVIFMKMAFNWGEELVVFFFLAAWIVFYFIFKYLRSTLYISKLPEKSPLSIENTNSDQNDEILGKLHIFCPACLVDLNVRIIAAFEDLPQIYCPFCGQKISKLEVFPPSDDEIISEHEKMKNLIQNQGNNEKTYRLGDTANKAPEHGEENR